MVGLVEIGDIYWWLYNFSPFEKIFRDFSSPLYKSKNMMDV